MDRCAPNKQFEQGSCFTIKDLENITNEYNKIHPNNKKSIIKEKRFLLKTVNSIMKDEYNCKENDQVCWVESKLLKNNENEEIKQIANDTFRPPGPKGIKDWLSTSDINRVMLQYEAKFKDFKFFGAVPRDFNQLPQLEICDVNIKKLVSTGKTKMGMVINLDTSEMNGSHWVALYANLNKNQIYFFDSFAEPPKKEFTALVRKLLNYMYCKTNNIDVELDNFTCKVIKCKQYDIQYNKKQHQFKNSECGVYSMNFIIRLLNGESFRSIEADIIKDDKMLQCRGTYFRDWNY
jgi:hypothetical protein